MVYNFLNEYYLPVPICKFIVIRHNTDVRSRFAKLMWTTVEVVELFLSIAHVQTEIYNSAPFTRQTNSKSLPLILLSVIVFSVIQICL